MSATAEEVARHWNNLYEQDIAKLERTGNYRVLRRFVPRLQYAPGEGHLHGLVVDCEGTGLDTENDKMIEISLVRFTFDDKGIVHSVMPPITMREDPGAPLSGEIVSLTGITDEMLKGQKFDDAVVEERAYAADVVIAHAAKYDRPMFERRFPSFAERPWGCTQKDIDWPKFGIRSATLDYILSKVAGCFHEAHGAEQDALALLHCLAQGSLDARDPAYSGKTVLRHLLDGVRTPHLCIEVNPPRGYNERLKERKYRAKYVDGKFSCWWKIVKPEEIKAEEDWFFRLTGITGITMRKISAYDRYSVRA